MCSSYCKNDCMDTRMNLTSCSLLLNRASADPIMALDFAVAEARNASVIVSVYNGHNSNLPCNSNRDVKLKEQSAKNFNCFCGKMALIANRIRSNVATQSSGSAGCFYGKGCFQDNVLQFRYCRDTAPPGPLVAPGEPLWNETWTKWPRVKFINEISLPIRHISGLEDGLEPRLDPQLLASLEPDGETLTSGVECYRVCFCCRQSTATNGEAPASYRLLCWLHPVNSKLQTADTCNLQRRVEIAALNNYLCVFESLPSDVVTTLPAQLFFVAVEAGNWAVADWLMSRPGSGGVDVLDAWGDTELARLCQLGGNPEAVAWLLVRGADKRRRDVEGNTALHRLAAALRHLADHEASVLPALQALVGDSSREELLDWLAEENLAGEKPMALLSRWAALNWILSRLVMEQDAECPGINNESETSAKVVSLLICSSGFSVVHSFAAFGQLKLAEQAVKKWLGAPAWQQLIRMSIISKHHRDQQDDRQMRDYSAIHAAFQEGSWNNVKYLSSSNSSSWLRNNQAAWPPPVSAVDLAIREGHLDGYEKFQTFVSRAMPRPDFAEALGVLDRVEDCLASGVLEADRADCHGVPAVDNCLHRASRQMMIGKFQDPLLLALRSAFERDSAESLRDLIRSRGFNCSYWDLLSRCQDVELLRRLKSTLKLTEETNGFLGLLGFALGMGRWRLAGQLLSARQLDLLPACLAVMLCLKRWRRHCGSVPLPELVLPSRSSEDAVKSIIGSTQLPVELMNELYNLAKRIFCGAMVRLHRGAVTEGQRNLVLNYLGGRFHDNQRQEPQQRGPLFDDGDENRGISVFDMMFLTQEPELLALPCATDYVDRLMYSPMNFCCHTCRGPAGDCHDGAGWADSSLNLFGNWWPEEVASLRRALPRGWTPNFNMALTFVFNLVFACVLGYFVHEIGSKDKSSVLLGLKIFLLVCGFSYAMQELRDLLVTPFSCASGMRSCNKLCDLGRYVAFKWNLIDLAALLLLLFGIIAVLVLDHRDGSGDGPWYYTVRQILALSFALYCLRMLSILSYYERFSLYISMIKTTFVADFVPFLVVNAIFLIAFGFLIASVLFPGGRTYSGGQSIASSSLNRTSPLSNSDYLAEMFQRPLLAHFGEYGFSSLQDCKRKSSETECPHPLGNKLYDRFLLFIYLFVVSVLFINVLIAKLSLTVSREDERARVIWRKFRAKLLFEFSGAATPSLVLMLMLRCCLAIAWIARWLLRCCNKNNSSSSANATHAQSAAPPADTKERSAESGVTSSSNKSSASTESASCSWWHSNDLADAPEGYKQYLLLQAMQFRKFRHTFSHYQV